MYQIMFYGGMVTGMLSLAFAVFFFVKQDVAKGMGDVSGWNARKSLKEMQKNAGKEGKIPQKPKNFKQAKKRIKDGGPEECPVVETEVLPEKDHTELLSGERKEMEQLLREGEIMLPDGFEVIEEIMVVHTEEQI